MVDSRLGPRKFGFSECMRPSDRFAVIQPFEVELKMSSLAYFNCRQHEGRCTYGYISEKSMKIDKKIDSDKPLTTHDIDSLVASYAREVTDIAANT